MTSSVPAADRNEPLGASIKPTPDGSPAPAAPGRARDRARGMSLPGSWGAVVFVCLSFTPSLLPRNGVVQGVVTGINAWIGYGLGVLAAVVWRAFADRGPRVPRPAAWRVFQVAGLIAVTTAFLLGQRWQGNLRGLMGAPPDPLWRTLLAPVVAVAVFAVLFVLARVVRRVTQWLIALLARWIGRPAARALGWLVVATGVFLLVTGVLIDGILSFADRTFATGDAIIPEDVTPPESGLRSGGPGSLVPWETLGRQGRIFVSGRPSVADIAAFLGQDATDPIRAYAGIATAEDAEDRAKRVVDDLERAGGFRRANLLVATTTGTGWLEPGSMAAFEYLSEGDSAIVSMQYSHVPSGISFLVDQNRARRAGRTLFDAVYERWSAMPPTQRPRLYAFGESLGSFGMEGAFSGEHDLRNRIEGALFVGAPDFNVLRQEFGVDRDPGSPQVEPVYRGGRTVRFSNEIETGAAPRDIAWTGTRVLYLQHPSDPIVWWNPSLLLTRPDWLEEPRGRDVLDEMIWIPFVTFWQITLDMLYSVDVPEGHGHRYTGEAVDAWATILQPPNWNAAKADRLQEVIQR